VAEAVRVAVAVGEECGGSVRVAVGIGVLDGLLEVVGDAWDPPTAAMMTLLHVEPGFFTHHDEVGAGPWYPLATICVADTEFVVSWMPL
jgi:hypothetical protein